MKLSNTTKEELLLYGVTDRAWLNGETLYSQIEKALKGGVTFMQLREKKLDEESFLKEAIEIKELCRKYNVPFVIMTMLILLWKWMLTAFMLDKVTWKL